MAPAKPALEAERSCSRGHGNHFDSLLAARAAVGQAARANARADGPGEPARPVAHALSRGGQRPVDRVEGLLEGALGPADMAGRAALDPPELHTGGAHAARRLRAKRLELVLALRDVGDARPCLLPCDESRESAPPEVPQGLPGKQASGAGPSCEPY